MLAMRRWVVRNAGLLERLYAMVRPLLRAAQPVVWAIGPQRVHRPLAAVEGAVKGFLFDCNMCGRCALSGSGMSCPMNCPKQVRNGPCGGVRANGNCEVIPDMPCVWVKAWEGSRQMAEGDTILNVQQPVDQSIKETSTWLRVVREKTVGAAAR